MYFLMKNLGDDVMGIANKFRRTSYYHPQMVPLVTPAPVAKGKLL